MTSRFDSKTYHSFTDYLRKKQDLVTKIYKRYKYIAPLDLKIVEKLPYEAKVLDIGTGPGIYIKRLLEIRDDLKIVGLDMSKHPEFPDHFATFKELKMNSDTILPFNDSEFDLIVCTDLIEHLHTEILLNLMNETKRLLKINGYLYLKTRDTKFVYFGFWDDPTHIRPFSENSLKRLGYMFDLKIVKTWKRYGFAGVIFAPAALFTYFHTKNRIFLESFLDCIIGFGINIIFKKVGK